jgi:hypothetical protein
MGEAPDLAVFILRRFLQSTGDETIFSPYRYVEKIMISREKTWDVIADGAVGAEGDYKIRPLEGAIR